MTLTDSLNSLCVGDLLEDEKVRSPSLFNPDAIYRDISQDTVFH